MNQDPRPAWLIVLAAGLSATALGAVVGCARLGSQGFLHSKQIARGDTSLSSMAGARVSFAFSPESAGRTPGSLPDALGPCPADMASIDGRFCVDRYEASLVEILADGREQPWPHYLPVDGHLVRAVSTRSVYPQGYISEHQAIEACGRSGKRLCKPAEWRTACQGPDPKKYGYAAERQAGACNDRGRSPMMAFFGPQIANGKGAWTWERMNDPQLNQLGGTVAETGSHDHCTNGYGVYDMVGNLHEWVDDPQGTFQGGYYLDVTLNGEGCGYRTDAHEAWYHDYSTGFRCCADANP